jgi:hypothetical protein
MHAGHMEREEGFTMGVPHEQARDFLISTSPAYFRSAEALLRRSMPGARLRRLAPDTALLSLDHGDAGHVAEVVRADVPFVRHLGSVVRSVDASDDVTPESVAEQVAANVPPDELGVSLQVWASGDAPLDPTRTRRVVEQAIRGLGIDVQYGERQRVVGLVLCASLIVVTVTPLDEALCDWPGGRMRFKATPAQISRAEFKLKRRLLSARWICLTGNPRLISARAPAGGRGSSWRRGSGFGLSIRARSIPGSDRIHG